MPLAMPLGSCTRCTSLPPVSLRHGDMPTARHPKRARWKRIRWPRAARFDKSLGRVGARPLTMNPRLALLLGRILWLLVGVSGWFAVGAALDGRATGAAIACQVVC